MLFLNLLVAPEEPFDGRSLYDRLKEQRDAKDLEFEESRKFKNMIRGLDESDADHLNEIQEDSAKRVRKQIEEEKNELNGELSERFLRSCTDFNHFLDYRAQVAKLQEISAEKVEHHQTLWAFKLTKTIF